MQRKILIGWREYVDLPEWGVEHLKAKVDTGATTSALHVENIKKLRSGRISFDVVLEEHHHNKVIHVVTRPVKKGKVKSSIGLKTTRWYVATKLRIGPIEREIKISLINRSEMKHRMILGRTALAGDFLIDINHSYLLGN